MFPDPCTNRQTILNNSIKLIFPVTGVPTIIFLFSLEGNVEQNMQREVGVGK